jgi:hypothetical protein
MMTEDVKKGDKMQQVLMKFKACRHNDEKAVITHVLVLLLFSSMFVVFTTILVPLTASLIHYSIDLLGDKRFNKCWYF